MHKCFVNSIVYKSGYVVFAMRMVLKHVYPSGNLYLKFSFKVQKEESNEKTKRVCYHLYGFSMTSSNLY